MQSVATHSAYPKPKSSSVAVSNSYDYSKRYGPQVHVANVYRIRGIGHERHEQAPHIHTHEPPPSTSILFASWWHLRITTSQAVYPNPHCAVNAGAGVYPTLHRRVYSIPSHQVRFLIAARLRPSKHPAIPCVRIVPALLLRPHMTQACLRVSRNVPRCCPPCFSWYKNL